MNETIYIENINKILNDCNSIVNKDNDNKEVKLNNNNNPYALKSFKTMYNKFLYLKDLNNKREIKKNTVEKKLIESYDDLLQ